MSQRDGVPEDPDADGGPLVRSWLRTAQEMLRQRPVDPEQQSEPTV